MLQRCIQTRSLISNLYFGALLFVILVTGCIVSNLSLHSVAITFKKQANTIHPIEVHGQLRSNPTLLTLLSVKEDYLNETRHQKLPANDQSSEEATAANPVSQHPLREKESIGWLVRKYPNIEMLKSNALSKQFISRAQSFFGRECDIRFFMTWISPATSFGKKEFLALQSVFKHHPNGCLMILSRCMDSGAGRQILSPLTARGFKVTALTPDLQFLFNNTPAKAWFDAMNKGLKNPGRIPFAQNLSNLLRLVTLYKYGGVYLDTDFIVLKSFSGLRNSIGAQSVDAESGHWSQLNNAVLVFDQNHPLLYKFVENFAYTFDGSRWGFNGPFLVTRVVRKVSRKPGYNFTVLPPEAFYPVDWIRIRGYFAKPKTRNQSEWIDATVLQLHGETYGVHLWNKESGKLRIEQGSVIGKLVSNSCVICENIYST